MPEQPSTGAPALAFADKDIERRKRIVGLDSDDIARIVALKDIVTPRVDDYVDVFFHSLASADQTSVLFVRPDALDEARRRKREHLIALVAGDYGRDYVEQRIALARLYSRNRINTCAFLGTFNQLMWRLGLDIMKQLSRDRADALQKFLSLNKVSSFDIGIIVDVLIAESESMIGQQRAAIRELSTPVLQVRDRLLILPIIGMIDSQRAKQLTDELLRAIRANRARVVVMDITGVAAVDSKVANHLIQTVAASRLMGSTVIITGLTAEVAQSLVALGVDLGRVNTMSDLQSGLEEAERMLGYTVTRRAEVPFQPQST